MLTGDWRTWQIARKTAPDGTVLCAIGVTVLARATRGPFCTSAR